MLSLEPSSKNYFVCVDGPFYSSFLVVDPLVQNNRTNNETRRKTETKYQHAAFFLNQHSAHEAISNCDEAFLFLKPFPHQIATANQSFRMPSQSQDEDHILKMQESSMKTSHLLTLSSILDE